MGMISAIRRMRSARLARPDRRVDAGSSVCRCVVIPQPFVPTHHRDVASDLREQQRLRLVSIIWDSCLAQLLYALVKFDVAELLAGGPASVETLAERSGAHAPSLYRLLRAAVTVDLLAVEGKLFQLTSAGQLLRAGTSGSLRNTILLYGSEDKWRSWGALDYSVRTGQDAYQYLFGQSYFERLSGQPEQQAIFNSTMAGLSRAVSQAVREHPEIARCRRMVDVGGGSGGMLAGILPAHTHMRGVLYDTESGLVEADATLSAAGVRDRCEIVSGDFFKSVPEGADGYLLKHILHDWDDERATTVLRRCREALSADGRMLVIESVVPATPSELSKGILLRDLNMLTCLPGRERTQAEFAELFRKCDLKLESVTPLPPPGQPYSLLVAVPG